MSEKTRDFRLHLGLIERGAFFILRVTRVFQDILSQIFWNVFATPILWVMRLAFANKKNRKMISLKDENFWQHRAGQALNVIMAINGWLNGLHANFIFFDRLLIWNPALPVIALKNKQSKIGKNYVVAWLGEEDPNNKGWYSLYKEVSFGTSKVAGYFRIVQKEECDDGKNVQIKCIWIKGKMAGKVFTINRSNPFCKDAPDQMYFPPKIFTLIIEMLLSLSFLSILTGLGKVGFEYVTSLHFLGIFLKGQSI